MRREEFIEKHTKGTMFPKSVMGDLERVVQEVLLDYVRETHIKPYLKMKSGFTGWDQERGG